MKIAIASERNKVAQHFGHCAEFTIYEIDNNQIKSINNVANPGHRPGFLPVFLNDLGVNVIISGGMGQGAIDIFNDKNIEVIVGATGNVQDIVELYLQGNLNSTGSICHQHMHHGNCSN